MPERHRRDLMGECNVDAYPIDSFTTECCANCVNPECTRSLAGKARFDARTRTWFEHYFGDKDRMDPADPRFSRIAGQKFLVIDPGLLGRAPEVGSSSAWLDPRELEQPPAPPPAPVSRPPAAQEVRRPVAQEAPAEAPRPRQVPQHLLLANVPLQGGQRVPAPPSASTAPPPVRDPWAAPAPDSGDTPVVSPGARVKMGGPGV